MAPGPDEVEPALVAFYAAPIEGDERDFTLTEFFVAPHDQEHDDADAPFFPGGGEGVTPDTLVGGERTTAGPDGLRMFAELAAVAAGQVQGGTVVGLVVSSVGRGVWTVDLPV